MGALLFCAHAAAAPAPLQFSSLPQKIDSSEIQVFGGSSPIAGDWNSILVARMPAGSDLRSCTATLVGPDVLLTAAHCVDANEPTLRQVVLDIDTHKVRFTCQIDDRYRRRPFKAMWPRGPEDWALCVRDAGPAPPSTFVALRRETLDLSALSATAPVLITGYGCVEMEVDLDKPELTFGDFKEVFTVGDETVEHPASTHAWMTTNSAQAREPALCQGDSGGPLFTGATTSAPLQQRWVRAVNSYVSVATKELISTYSALGHPTFGQFLACWRRDHPGATIKLKDGSLVPACPN